MIEVLITDIDGVLTNGKAFISGENETKTVCYQDLDALSDIRNEGIKIAVVTGEENEFTDYINKKVKPDFIYTQCKNKEKAVLDIAKKANVSTEKICYIGDGKYDIPAMKIAGLSVCPANAIRQVRDVADVVLERKGGDGCIAEAYSFWKSEGNNSKINVIRSRIQEHRKLVTDILYDEAYMSDLHRISEVIVDSYHNGGKLLLCGNGGSAADAQHLAAELVSRFYKERKALSAEALNTNTSIITAIGNDYDYSRIFSRGVEAQGNPGDVLIGLTTSGKSKNIIEAFQMAKNLGITTVLFTGILDDTAEILKYTDYRLSVPSKDTPRIQEMHILSGHIMCELIENKFVEGEV
jgi:D-sedoheptulose 7-phosphate isomerase